MTFARIFLIAAICLGLDQLSKWYVVWKMDLFTIGAIDVVPPYLNFRMGWNDGVNFGLFAVDKWILIAVAFGICLALLFWARNLTGWMAAILFGLIIGGALGNVLDRIIYGAVADFLNMSCCGFTNPTSFNVADVFVFAGAIGLLIFGEKLPKRT